MRFALVFMSQFDTSIPVDNQINCPPETLWNLILFILEPYSAFFCDQVMRVFLLATFGW
jgi:hypothetical protein